MVTVIKNNNGKIVYKIAFRSLKAEKLRNLFVMITITMTAALISGLAGFSAGNKKEEERELSSMPHVIYANITDKQIENLRKDEHIEEMVIYKRSNSFETDGYVLNAGYFQNNTGRIDTLATEIKEGRYPEKMNEVAVDKAYMECIGKQAETGAGLTVTWLDGTTEHYIVSGYTDSKTTAKNFMVLFSEEYARNGSQLKNIPFSSGARICNAEDMGRDEFLNEIKSIGEQYGIERYNISENSQFVNSKSRTSTELLTVIGVSTAILLASILVIYSIFYLSITSRIRELGQLRTIGMTSKQLRKTVNIEGALLAFWGVLAGLLIGTAFAYALKPAGFYFPNTLAVGLFTAVLDFTMVQLSIRKPAKIAASVSPVEAAKLSGYGPDRARTKYRKLTPFGLARISVKRNRKKFRMTVMSLGIAGTLFLCGTTLLSSYNREEYSRQLAFYFGEYVLGISSNAEQLAEHGLADIQMSNPLSEELLNRIASLDGVNSVTVMERLEVVYEYNNYRSDDCAAPFNREDTELLSRYIENGAAFDYDRMVRDKEIIITGNDLAEEIFGWRFREGEKVLLRWFDGTDYREDSFQIAGCIDNILDLYNDKNDNGKRFCMGGGWFLIPRGLIEHMVPESYSLNNEFAISVRDWKTDTKVKEFIQTLTAENSTLAFKTLSEEMEENENIYLSLEYIIYGLSAFITGFGLINLINTLVSNVISRKQEFAMLRSIGMSTRQLSRMIIGEGLMLVGKNLIITLTLGTAAGYALIYAMKNLGANYLHWHFPVWYLLGYAAFVIAAPVIISESAIKLLDRKTLVERLREIG